MRLSEALRGVPVLAVHGSDVEVTGVTADSRLVAPGALFVAIPGLRTDGARFASAAVQQGAAAVMAQSPVEVHATTIEVSDAREALALAAANVHGRPAERLSLIGVTGTSGKTTTARMIESVLDATGEPVGLIGTIEYRAGDERLTADRTTPDAGVLQEWFARMAAAGVRHAVMEVSSHALALKRTFGIRFAAAVFTNLSRDHFDFHRGFEDYFAAKRILFDQIDVTRRSAVVNLDDEYGRRLAAELPAAALTFGRSADAGIRPSDGFAIDVSGLRGTVLTPQGPVRVESSLLGLPNLYNWLGAIGAALSVGIPVPAIEAGIRNLKAVRGRFELVPSTGGPTVIVDYAHKPDALEKLLHAVREIAGRGRVVLLFGCGGDRDKGKRPQMAEIASRLADFTILTSDNPRGESAAAILDDIERGMTARDYVRIADRRAAIRSAITGAGNGDVVVVAGKGHETYQVVGDQILHFDDVEEAAIALKKRSEMTVPKSV